MAESKDSPMKAALSFEGLELAYASLAQAIDSAGEKNETVFLAKLVLLLAHENGDVAVFERAIKMALQDLDPKTQRADTRFVELS